MTLDKIKKYLRSKIKIKFIEVYDNSKLHNHLKKSLTHLKIVIISDDFANQKIINRHRMVFSKLSEIKKDKIYSITLNTYTLDEWEYKKHKKNSDLTCLKKNFIKIKK